MLPIGRCHIMKLIGKLQLLPLGFAKSVIRQDIQPLHAV
jgi:hypothetical protein